MEQANTWVDIFKALFIRFEIKAVHWVALTRLAFSIRLLLKMKINHKQLQYDCTLFQNTHIDIFSIFKFLSGTNPIS